MEVEASRLDNRSLTQLRPLSVQLGSLKNADGSATITAGNTCVLASVHGPIGAKSRQELIDRATIQVTVEPYTSAPSLKEVAMAQKLESLLSSIIFDLLHPRTLLAITIQPLTVDGSFFAVAVNAMIAALMDAGVPMKRTAFAASVLVDRAGQLYLDPDSNEEKTIGQSEHWIAVDPEDIEGTTAAQESFGNFDFGTVPKVRQFALTHAIPEIRKTVLKAVEEKITKLAN